MRSEAIDEPVAVRADFLGGVITPVMFRRRSREHRVTRVNTRWLDRTGRHPRLFFSVTDANGGAWLFVHRDVHLAAQVDDGARRRSAGGPSAG